MLIEISSCLSESRGDYNRSAVSVFDSASEAKAVGCESQGMDCLLNISFLADASEDSPADLILFRNDSFASSAPSPVASASDSVSPRFLSSAVAAW